MLVLDLRVCLLLRVFKRQEFNEFSQREQNSFDRRWSNRTYQYDYEKIQLEAERDSDLAQLEIGAPMNVTPALQWISVGR